MEPRGTLGASKALRVRVFALTTWLKLLGFDTSITVSQKLSAARCFAPVRSIPVSYPAHARNENASSPLAALA
jgi:hypothetical protein